MVVCKNNKHLLFSDLDVVRRFYEIVYFKHTLAFTSVLSLWKCNTKSLKWPLIAYERIEAKLLAKFLNR